MQCDDTFYKKNKATKREGGLWEEVVQNLKQGESP